MKAKTLRNIGLGFLILILAALIGGRIYLPYWLTDYVNGQIAALNGYGGGVRDIDVHLWRGAYQIHDLNIHKTRGGLKEPFFAARTVDLSIEWEALFKGAVVAEIDLYDADLNFAASQTGKGANWSKFVDALSPFEINRFELHGGKIAYINRNAQPPVNLFIKDITGKVENLRQVTAKDKRLPSPAMVTGTSIGGGRMNITGNLNILKNDPDFDLNAKLEGASLAAFNEYALDFAAVEFKSGKASVYSELAVADNRITGYVKPIINDVEVEYRDAGPLTILWRGLIDMFVGIFKNHPRDQFAMRIPIEGQLNNPEMDGWETFLSIFSNAFGKAFARNTDGTISFNDALIVRE